MIQKPKILRRHLQVSVSQEMHTCSTMLSTAGGAEDPSVKQTEVPPLHS